MGDKSDAQMSYSNYIGCDSDGGEAGFGLRILLDKINFFEDIKECRIEAINTDFGKKVLVCFNFKMGKFYKIFANIHCAFLYFDSMKNAIEYNDMFHQTDLNLEDIKEDISRDLIEAFTQGFTSGFVGK